MEVLMMKITYKYTTMSVDELAVSNLKVVIVCPRFIFKTTRRISMKCGIGATPELVGI
jgi:hypothetical protein